MRIRCRVLPPFRALLLLAAFLPALPAQASQSAASEGLLNQVPSALDVHAAALGKRVQSTGFERTILNLSVVDEGGARTYFRVTLQLPNLVKIALAQSNNPPLVFDGVQPVLARSRREEQLMETFCSDIAEVMIASVKSGSQAAHFLGRRVTPGPDGLQDDSHQYDVFEVAGAVGCNTAERLKRYYFDSQSGLLFKTQYLDETVSPSMTVETVFSEWRSQDGSAYPARIDRLENGRLVYSIIVGWIVALPRQDPDLFAHSY